MAIRCVVKCVINVLCSASSSSQDPSTRIVFHLQLSVFLCCLCMIYLWAIFVQLLSKKDCVYSGSSIERSTMPSITYTHTQHNHDIHMNKKNYKNCINSNNTYWSSTHITKMLIALDIILKWLLLNNIKIWLHNVTR